MACTDCCYLVNTTQIRDLLSLQIDSTFTDKAGKIALDQAHELALDGWITDECRQALCETLELERTTPSPTPTQLIEFEQANCFLYYIRRYLAYQTISYFVQLNPSVRVSGSGVGRGAISQQRPFTPAEGYEKEGLVTNWTSFAQAWRDKAERWLDKSYSNVLFPSYEKNRDFFPCLPEQSECEEPPPSYGAGFYVSTF